MIVQMHRPAVAYNPVAVLPTARRFRTYKIGAELPARSRRGVGDGYSDAEQALSMGGSLAAGTLGVLGTVGGTTITGASTGAIAAGTAATAATLVGVGVAAVMVALTLIKNSGCGQTCIIASNDANKIEPLLEANLDGYFAGPRTQASKAQSLANFDEIWSALYNACSSPQLGDAGKRCISDRQAGSCKWKQSAEGYARHPYPGVPQPGQCWNWFSGYRSPIADDSPVAPASLADLGAAFGSGGFSVTSLLIPAALLAALWAVS